MSDMNYIYSESLDEMIPKGFTKNGRHYSWDDSDVLYWRDDVDDVAYEYDDVNWNKVEIG